MPIDYNPDKYVFRHHVIPETNEGLDIGRAGLRFGTIRAAACTIDSGTFQTVTASTLLLGVESVTSVLPTTSAAGLVAVTNTATPSVAARTITGSSAITVTNGDGVSGNPTLNIAALGVTNAMLAGSIDLTTKVTGVLPTAQGGTGLASGTSGGILGFTAAGTIASSALLTANALLLGGGSGATPTVMGSLGTTTTVLHGNAAGAPTFGAVALGTDVSGTLAAAQFPALTGDITTVAGALATTLKNTGPGATGPIGSTTVTPVITIDAQGRVTALTSATIAGGVPSGAIVMIASGSCPSGFTEYTGARGRFIVGVPLSGTLAGTAGSAMTDLQNPSVTPTFTGSALAGHQHQTVLSLAGSGDTFFDADLSFGTSGSFNVTWAKQVGVTSVETRAAALTQSVTGGTPAGTISAVASNSLAPYIQLMFCQKT